MNFIFTPIGLIHTPFLEKKETPIQSARSAFEGTVQVFPEFEAGLDGIEDFSRIYLIYGFHLSERSGSLAVRPFLDDIEHGVFATRYPVRPNPIGLSIVELIRREGTTIFIRGVDMLDGTPLLDIKPYTPDFDVFEVSKIGWYQHRKYK